MARYESWFPVQIELLESNEVFELSRELDVTAFDAYGRVVYLFELFDRCNAINGHAIKKGTPEYINHLYGDERMWNALEKTKWTKQEDGKLLLLNYFDRREKMLKSARNRRWKEGARETPTRRQGDKKRKEKKSIEESKKKEILEVQIPGNLDSKEFAEAWSEWIEHKLDISDPMTPRAAKMALKRISTWGKQRAIAAIEYSIGAKYKGIFEEKQNGSRPQAPRQEVMFKDVNRE